MVRSKKRALTSLLLLPLLLLACQGAPAEGGVVHTGSVQMALVSSSNGATYRLHGAQFAVTGPTPTTLDSDVQPDATQLTTTLAVGDYQVALQDGWDLERLDNGTYETIQATLISPNPTAFTISDGGVTSLVYQFQTSGGVITIGTGTLDIGIAVTASGGGGGAGGSTGTGSGAGTGGSSRLLGPPVTINSNFAPGTSAIPGVYSVAVADINNDGLADFVAADARISGVSVMFNDNPDSPSGFPAGDSPIALATADFDHDGSTDVVVADEATSTAPGGIDVLFNDHSGFAAPVQLSAGGNPVAVAVGDLDGDGFADIAAADFATGQVSILFNLRNRSFSAPIFFTAGAGPEGIAIGDLNGDSRQDIVVANSTDGTVSVLINNGLGSFGPAVTYSAGTGADAVALADLNGDGALDAAVANFDGTVSVLLNVGNGRLGLPVTLRADVGSAGVSVGDIDGDGHPDLVVANFGTSGGAAGDVSVFLNRGNASFDAALNFPATGNPTSVALGDVDGDGKLDVVVGFDGAPFGVDVLLNTGSNAVLVDGTFSGSGSCQGIRGLAGCTVSITVAGTGAARSVSSFQISPAIFGSSGTITQTGDALAIDLLSDAGVGFCPSTHFTGSGMVGSSGGSMIAVSLTGPNCGGSETVGAMLDLTLQ
jgi:FG-GAP-like repeat